MPSLRCQVKCRVCSVCGAGTLNLGAHVHVCFSRFSANGLSGITLKKDNVVNTQPSKKNANQNQTLLHNCDFV